MVLSPDADPDNADWTKRTWDLDIDSVDELMAYLRARGLTMEEFKKLPAYRLPIESGRAPDWLKEL